METKAKQFFLLGLAIGVALFAAVGALGVSAGESVSFETLKSLHGDWAKAEADGTAGDQVTNSFRLTAAGNALLEKVFPGTGHEMVTLYYLKGGEVALTHYCVEGNQPTMRLAKATANEIEFECTGEGLGSENERHMHRAKFTIIDSDHIRSQWFEYENGENVYTADFNLARRPTGDGGRD